ncbi:tetratricopeptide repeat protein [Lacinutrix algicola]|uniref:tetratricopeptide repeat protein n=1 Tax=Lacinutrix algicola TaxID=342954 RepID=UPI0006E2A28A|nr:tetratricopeptide repeat protein [Lacinutrix algicola]
MKKQLIFTLALLVTLFSFGQKKELKVLEKAVKNNNFAEAKAAAVTLESMLGSMDDKMKSKFYYNRAKALYANGAGNVADFDTAFNDLNKVDQKYVSDLAETKKFVQNELLVKGNSFYTGGKYTQAASLFSMLYKLVPEDQSYLYYAAVSSVLGKDFDSALNHYTALKELGYTGITTEYFAVNKETGEEEVFDKGTRDLYVKAKTHIKPGERETKSKVGEIYGQITSIYLNQGENEKALESIKEARIADPSNSDLIVTEANVQLKLGNELEYGKLIKEAIANDPNNTDLIYNLGVISNQAENKADAEMYYKKVIEIDPNYINALKNISALILEEDAEIVKKMNVLTNSNADNKIYDQLQKDRGGVYQKAIPYLESVIKLDTKLESADFARTLSNIYSVVGESEKAKALKAKYGL